MGVNWGKLSLISTTVTSTIVQSYWQGTKLSSAKTVLGKYNLETIQLIGDTGLGVNALSREFASYSDPTTFTC